METIVGYFASGLIGISLGLIGGGGSIITIPVLVYLFHIEPSLATAYSLFIVGSTSLVGGIKGAISRQVDFRSAMLYAVPSTVGVYVTRHFFLPYIPDTIFELNGFTLHKDVALMLLFSLIMLVASVQMIRNKPRSEQSHSRHIVAMLVFQGLGVGIITGIIGAGGGFLIIPALVLLAGLPMKKAIGTSLIIIAINSLIGFLGDISLLKEIDFSLMFLVSMLAVGGVFLGTYYQDSSQQKISSQATEEGREEEVVTRLACVGFDNTMGYLKNGLKAWLQSDKEIDRIDSISATEFAQRGKAQKLTTIDVRKPSEFEAEHVKNAISIPLDFINSRLAEIPKEGEVYVYCAGGYRSMIAVSILKSRGWSNLIDVKVGFKAIAETDVPCTDYVCTKTEKKKK